MSRIAVIHTAISAALGAVLLFVPLFGDLGPECALALGMVVPFLCAGEGGSRGGIRGMDRDVLDELAKACGMAFVFTALPTGILCINVARGRVCEPGSGLAFIALGPLLGGVFAAVCGFALTRTFGSRRAVRVASYFIPVTGLFVWAYDFYFTPGVFAFGHFFGWYQGTPYDEGFSLPEAFLSFRLVTLSALVSLAAYVIGTTRARSILSSRSLWLVAALMCAGAFVTATKYRAELGHAASTAYIRDKLGAIQGGSRCDVVLPRETPLDRRNLLALDCDFRVAQAERTLGLRYPRRLVAFFFRDEDEKQKLMGAGSTQVAKPWRNEVYVHGVDFPHPVLGHEVAHAVAAVTGIGPFRVSGQLGGVLVDQAYVEGLAVAVAFEPSEGLNPHEWALALMKTDHAPTLAQIFGRSFLLQSSSRAYTLAGSFFRFILDRYGAGTLRAAYRSASVERATGKGFEALEREWKQYLMEMPIPMDAVELARARFARGPIFARPCPHLVSRLRDDLTIAVTVNDLDAQENLCSRILSVDRGEHSVRLAQLSERLRSGDRKRAEEIFSVLQRDAPLVYAAKAREAFADDLWRRGRADASAAYEAILRDPLTRDSRRLVELKHQLALHYSMSGIGAGYRASIAFFVPERKLDAVLTLALADELARERADGLGDYLAGRLLLGAGSYEMASNRFEQAGRRGLPTRALLDEGRRLGMIAAYGAGNRALAARIASDLLRDTATAPQSRWEATEMQSRVLH